MVVTLVGLLLPLAVLPIYSSMANVSRDYLEVAQDLGARRFHLVRTVLLPMTLPGVGAAFAFSFLLAAGDFVTPALVGGTQSIMIGNVIADQFRGIGAELAARRGARLRHRSCIVMLIYLAVMRLLRWVTRW